MKDTTLPASGSKVWNEEPPEEGQVLCCVMLLMGSRPTGMRERPRESSP